jgi:PAS domain S-box-containing protein
MDIRIPLSLKISFGVIAVVLLQTGVLLFNAYNDLVDSEIEETKEEIHITLSRLQQTLEFLSQKNEFEQIQTELSSLSSNAYIKHVILADNNNKIIASSQLSHINNNLFRLIFTKNNAFLLDMFTSVRKNVKSSIWIDSQKNILYAIYPVFIGLNQKDGLIHENTGIIFAHVDLQWINTDIKYSLQNKAAPLAFMLGILAIFFTIYLNLFLSRRIKNISTAASEFSESGYNSRALVSGKDELSDLAQSFNNMAETVSRQSKQLIKKEADLSLVLNSIADAIITINESGIIQSFSKQAESMFGYSESEAINRNINIIMPEPYRSEHDSYLLNYINTGDAHIIGTGRDMPAQNKNGHVFTIRLIINEIPSSDGNTRLFLGSCLDITILKEQEQQLRQSQKMDALGKLTGGIAHDYNNMLGVIIGYSELLKNKLSDNPKLKKYANEIHHAGNRGAKLTKKLLAFSRQKATEMEVININDLLNENKNMLEKTLTVRIKLNFNLDPELHSVFIDHSDLEDSILNMCINSMHAMEDGGQLTIYTQNISLTKTEADELNLSSPDNNYVVLKICDDGTGIDNVTLSRIFDPFFSTKGDKGTGLGLSQVYGFVNRNHGIIKVDSILNEGTCFTLCFPKYQDNKSIEISDNKISEIQDGNETILVVDDEESLRHLVKEILDNHGYKVLLAESGHQALEILQAEHVDLLLSDIIMPGMDGYQLAQTVHQKYPAIKIQLASGFSDDRHKKTEDLGLHAHILDKPFNQQQLLGTIRKLLDHTKVDISTALSNLEMEQNNSGDTSS